MLGGPGCGKTTVIAAKIAALISSGAFDASEIAAMTYTRAMARDLRQRIGDALPAGLPCHACAGTRLLDGYGCGACSLTGIEGFTPPRIGTLHALAAGWCRDALDGRVAGGDAVRATGWVDGADFGIAMPEDVDAIVSAVYAEFRKKVRRKDLVDGLRLRGGALSGWPKPAAARQQLRLRGLVCYDDLPVMLLAIITAPAEPGIPHLRERVRCLIVDEAHDLTPDHRAIVDAWAPESLLVVGDDGQRIFGFLTRGDGEDTGFMPWLGDDVIGLGENYRSQPAIVAAAARVREALVADGACFPLSATAMRPGVGGRVEVVTADAESLPVAIADTVTALLDSGAWDGAHRDYQPHEIAVLARTWAELDEAAAILAAAGIQASAPRDDRRWWGDGVGRIALAVARCGARGSVDCDGAASICASLGHTDPDGMIRAASMQAVTAGITLADALDADALACAGFERAGWWGRVAAARTVAALELVLDELCPFLTRAILIGVESARRGLQAGVDPDFDFAPAEQSVEDLLFWLASDDASARSVPAGHITLSTFHGAKGLEWPAVVILGACEGSIPARWDRTPAERAESARCLFVGMTRARDDLRIIVPTELRGKPRNPSPWLIAAGLAALNPAAAGEGES